MTTMVRKDLDNNYEGWHVGI